MAGMMGFMMLLGLLAFVGVVLMIALLVWFLVRRGRLAAVEDPAVEILRERYARGELSREEFEARRRDLGA